MPSLAAGLLSERERQRPGKRTPVILYWARRRLYRNSGYGCQGREYRGKHAHICLQGGSGDSLPEDGVRNLNGRYRFVVAVLSV
jgi:hypothetical protein